MVETQKRRSEPSSLLEERTAAEADARGQWSLGHIPSVVCQHPGQASVVTS